MSSNRENLHTVHLLAAFGAGLALTLMLLLWGPASPGSGPFAVASADAAKCKGASRSPAGLKPSKAESLTVCVVNQQRRGRGLKKVRMDRKLTRAARSHSRVMVKARCFLHVCPGEPDLGSRLAKAGYLPCGCSWNAGETIAVGQNRRSSPRSIVNAWMKSSAHRKILTGRSFQHVGVGVARGAPFSGNGTGRGGYQATYTLDIGYKR